MSSLASNPLWFATRAAGTIALVLLTATLVLGVAGARRYAPAAVGRFEIAALHRNLSVLSLALLVVHIGTAVADSYVPLGRAAWLVPFASPYRTVWVGLGTLAFDLLLAVAITSAARLRLGPRRWKAVHYSAYAAWPVAVFHAAGTGTDTKLAPELMLYGTCIAAVVIACWWRLYHCGPGHAAARSLTAVLCLAAAAAFYAFAASGPLAPGWSHRAQRTAAPAVFTAARMNHIGATG